MKPIVIIFNSLLIACCITQASDLHNFMASTPTTIKTEERVSLKSRIAYGENSFQSGALDEIVQESGMIFFSGVELKSSLDNSREMANVIYHLCHQLKDINSNSIDTAKNILSIMPKETDEQKLHYCVGLMCLGEAHLSHDIPTALTYFKRAASEHTFTGAMFNIGLLTFVTEEKRAGLDWLKHAQEHGLQNIEHIITNMKEACREVKEENIVPSIHGIN